MAPINIYTKCISRPLWATWWSVFSLLWLRFGRFCSLYIHYLNNAYTLTHTASLCTKKLKPCGNLLKNSRAHFDNLHFFHCLAHTIVVVCLVPFLLKWMKFLLKDARRCMHIVAVPMIIISCWSEAYSTRCLLQWKSKNKIEICLTWLNFIGTSRFPYLWIFIKQPINCMYTYGNVIPRQRESKMISC